MPVKVKSTLYGIETDAKTFQEIMELPEPEELTYSDLVALAQKIGMDDNAQSTNPAMVGAITKHLINANLSDELTGAAPEWCQIPLMIPDINGVAQNLGSHVFDVDGNAELGNVAGERFLFPCHVWQPSMEDTGDELVVSALRDKRLDEAKFSSETFYRGYMPNGMDFATVQYIQNTAQTYNTGKGGPMTDLFTPLTKILAYGLSWLMPFNVYSMVGLMRSLTIGAQSVTQVTEMHCGRIPNTMYASYFPRAELDADSLTIAFFNSIESLGPADRNAVNIVLPKGLGSSTIAMWVLGIAPYPVLPIYTTATYNWIDTVVGGESTWIKTAQGCHAINGPLRRINVIVGTQQRAVYAGEVATTNIQANQLLTVNNNPNNVITYDCGEYLHSWLGSAGFGKTLVAKAFDEAVSKLGAADAYNKALRMAMMMQVAYLPSQFVKVDGADKINTNKASAGQRWNYLASSDSLPGDAYGYLSPFGLHFRGAHDSRKTLANGVAWVQGPRKHLRIPRVNYAGFSLLMCGAAELKNPRVDSRDMIADTALFSSCILISRMAMAGLEGTLDFLGLNLTTWTQNDSQAVKDIRLTALFADIEGETDGFQKVVQEQSRKISGWKAFPEDRVRIIAIYRGFGMGGCTFWNSDTDHNRMFRPLYLDPTHFEFLKTRTNPLLAYNAMSQAVMPKGSWVPTRTDGDTYTLAVSFNLDDKRASLFFANDTYNMSSWFSDPQFLWVLTNVFRRARITGQLRARLPVAQVANVTLFRRAVRTYFTAGILSAITVTTAGLATCGSDSAITWSCNFTDAMTANNGGVITMATDDAMNYMLSSPSTTYFAINNALANIKQNFKRKPSPSTIPGVKDGKQQKQEESGEQK